MSRADILHLLTSTKSNAYLEATTHGLLLPFLPDNPLVISFEASEFDHETVATLVASLCETPKGFGAQAAKELYGACLQSFEDCGSDFETPQHQLDWEAEQSGTFNQPLVPGSADAIWPLVKLKEILISYGTRGPAYGKVVTIISGECAWDGEHGVGLIFTDGKTFVAVGGAMG